MKNPIKVKVTEKSSGNSYTQGFRDLAAARRFCAFVNRGQTSDGVKLSAVVL